MRLIFYFNDSIFVIIVDAPNYIVIGLLLIKLLNNSIRYKLVIQFINVFMLFILIYKEAFL